MNQTFENCTLLDTKTWFEKAVPEPTGKNFSTQLGVHLEEVAEMLQALEGRTPAVVHLLQDAISALDTLGEQCKADQNSVDVVDPLEMLDGICDQIVTATGVAHMLGYDVVAAMTEVNASNFSKFDAEGQPIFNENQKIMKGPNYFKPDLAPYLPT
ncbi:MAG: nucleoside triphosphate pyrophosphohydrolase family protein [Sphaerochaetaceae bacterium]|jgi:predicted HAD superfamily Cof-like phosphohydrolase